MISVESLLEHMIPVFALEGTNESCASCLNNGFVISSGKDTIFCKSKKCKCITRSAQVMTINPEVERLIRRFDLQAHPEGGHYTETYRSTLEVARQDLRVVRSASTAIYYLLSADAYSAWHRIESDEMWHFYKGGVLLIHVIDDAGILHTHLLGDALQVDEASFQVMV